jgi:ABC-type transport system substrate-binding protein
MNLPKFRQWEKFFIVLSKKEKRFFLICFGIFLVSLIVIDVNIYIKNTLFEPDFGGTYREGIVGQPRFVNPLYLATQDVDRDLVEVLFSGLLKYDAQGELENDLADSYEIKERGRVYDFKLKDNLFWQDKKPLTADDVVFTVELVQTPQYQSPLMKEWLGIRVRAMDSKTIRFSLSKNYFSFLETVSHLKILPKHIFQNISTESLPWALTSPEYLVGSGVFQFKELQKNSSEEITEFIVKRNKEVREEEKSFLDQVYFKFYDSVENLIKAARKGNIDGFSISDPKYLKNLGGFNIYELSVPRYFAVFFNLKNSEILEDKNIREALTLSIDKEKILQEVFINNGEIVNSPILPEYYGLSSPSEIYTFDTKEAESILDNAGFFYNEDKKYREKLASKGIGEGLTTNLSYGAKGEEVRKLQTCLRQDSEVYPSGTVSGYFGPKTRAAVVKFQEKYRDEILTPLGLTAGTGAVRGKTREKLNELCWPQEKESIPLKFSLTIVDKFPLPELAEALQKQWQELGIIAEIKKVSVSELETKVFKDRDFETLLFGESLGAMLDPFPFWHSSQREYPGLNLSYYKSTEADKLLESARETTDMEKRQESLEKFQDILLEDIPAIFLVRPNYIYVMNSKIKGIEIEKIIEPSKRFSTIKDWHIKTKRVWK